MGPSLGIGPSFRIGFSAWFREEASLTIAFGSCGCAFAKVLVQRCDGLGHWRTVRPSAMPFPAVVSLLDPPFLQLHWWLAGRGDPERLAGLLGALLQATNQPPEQIEELISVFEPLPLLATGYAVPSIALAHYHYRIFCRDQGPEIGCWFCQDDSTSLVSCCKPVALAEFRRRFTGVRDASS